MTSENVSPYGHTVGDEMECLSIPIELNKEPVTGGNGASVMKVGFKIGGGIDQDPTISPYKYPDTGIYITQIEPNGPAERAGLRQHDKILQVNGYDYTLLTHEKAVKYIKKYDNLKLLVARRGLAPT